MHLLEDIWRIVRIVLVCTFFAAALGSSWLMLAPVFLVAEIFAQEKRGSVTHLFGWIFRLLSLVPFCYITFAEELSLPRLRISLQPLSDILYVLPIELVLMLIIGIDIFWCLCALLSTRRK